MIAVSNLCFNYSSHTKLVFPDFTVESGDQFLLLGESGSGKTTLLHLMGGLLRNYSGSIVVDGTELNTLSEQALDKFRGKKMGFIFQRNHLIQALTVERNLKLSPYLAGLKIENSRIDELTKVLGVTDKRHSKISALSYGQAQRVAIARAVLNKPSIIFADEPTSALDDKNCERVISLLIDVAKQQGSTLVIATHDQRVKEKINNKIIL